MSLPERWSNIDLEQKWLTKTSSLLIWNRSLFTNPLKYVRFWECLFLVHSKIPASVVRINVVAIRILNSDAVGILSCWIFNWNWRIESRHFLTLAFNLMVCTVTTNVMKQLYLLFFRTIFHKLGFYTSVKPKKCILWVFINYFFC